MMTSAQLRAARALLGIDQRALAELARLSVPTVQRMEASNGVVRGNIESLEKLVTALLEAGVVLIDAGAPSMAGDRGVRLARPVERPLPQSPAQKSFTRSRRRGQRP